MDPQLILPNHFTTAVHLAHFCCSFATDSASRKLSPSRGTESFRSFSFSFSLPFTSCSLLFSSFEAAVSSIEVVAVTAKSLVPQNSIPEPDDIFKADFRELLRSSFSASLAFAVEVAVAAPDLLAVLFNLTKHKMKS